MNRTTTVLLSVVVAIVATIVPAILHGKLLNRWGINEALAEASQSLQELPKAYGPWTQIAEREPLSESIERELGLTEHFGGTYLSAKTGRRVQLLLMAGQSGPLVRHPPDICYAMSGNEQVGAPIIWSTEVGGVTHRFRVLHYTTKSVLSSDLYVTYGFFDGEKWDAPKKPRLSYGGRPWLWKMQVLSSDEPAEGEPVPEGTQNFLAEMIEASLAAGTPGDPS